jgi:hypothetical protein
VRPTQSVNYRCHGATRLDTVYCSDNGNGERDELSRKRSWASVGGSWRRRRRLKSRRNGGIGERRVVAVAGSRGRRHAVRRPSGAAPLVRGWSKTVGRTVDEVPIGGIFAEQVHVERSVEKGGARVDVPITDRFAYTRRSQQHYVRMLVVGQRRRCVPCCRRSAATGSRGRRNRRCGRQRRQHRSGEFTIITDRRPMPTAKMVPALTYRFPMRRCPPEIVVMPVAGGLVYGLESPRGAVRIWDTAGNKVSRRRRRHSRRRLRRFPVRCRLDLHRLDSDKMAPVSLLKPTLRCRLRTSTASAWSEVLPPAKASHPVETGDRQVARRQDKGRGNQERLSSHNRHRSTLRGTERAQRPSQDVGRREPGRLRCRLLPLYRKTDNLYGKLPAVRDGSRRILRRLRKS